MEGNNQRLITFAYHLSGFLERRKEKKKGKPDDGDVRRSRPKNDETFVSDSWMFFHLSRQNYSPSINWRDNDQRTSFLS